MYIHFGNLCRLSTWCRMCITIVATMSISSLQCVYTVSTWCLHYVYMFCGDVSVTYIWCWHLKHPMSQARLCIPRYIWDEHSRSIYNVFTTCFQTLSCSTLFQFARVSWYFLAPVYAVEVWQSEMWDILLLGLFFLSCIRNGLELVITNAIENLINFCIQ